jgi:hypothetical protein
MVRFGKLKTKKSKFKRRATPYPTKKIKGVMRRDYYRRYI